MRYYPKYTQKTGDYYNDLFSFTFGKKKGLPTEEERAMFLEWCMFNFYNGYRTLWTNIPTDFLQVPEPYTLDYIDGKEIEAVRDKDLDNGIDGDIFNYEIDKYGFRNGDRDILTDPAQVLTLGCSFTFGIGVSTKNSWPGLLEKSTKESIINFGFPGGSINTIVRLLIKLTSLRDFEKVFILLPPLSRREIVHDTLTKHPAWPAFDVINSVPGLPPRQFDKVKIEAQHLKLHKTNSTVQVTYLLYIIKFLCEAKNIKLTIMSWDKETLELLPYIFDENQIGPEFRMFHTQFGLGRDKAHPSKKAHLEFMKDLKKHLKKYS